MQFVHRGKAQILWKYGAISSSYPHWRNMGVPGWAEESEDGHHYPGGQIVHHQVSQLAREPDVLLQIRALQSRSFQLASLVFGIQCWWVLCGDNQVSDHPLWVVYTLCSFLSSNCYFQIIYHALMTIRYLMDVELNRITPEDYIRLSRFEWNDYVYSKNHVSLYLFRKEASAI